VTDKALRAMEQRSLLQAQKSAGGWQFQFQPLIQRYLQQTGGKQTTAHARAMHYFQERCLPLHKETAASAIAPYLARFYHLCELGHYGWALSSLQQETVEGERYSSCDMFLKFQGSGLDRLELKELYARLLESWHPQTSEERRQFGDALQAIGDVLQFLKQSRDALSRYDEALAIYRTVGDRLGEANTLKAIGDVLQFLDQRSDALSRYDEALAIYRTVGDRLGEANSLNGQGNVYRSLDQVDQAIGCHQQALKIHQTIGARAGEAFTLWALAKDHEALEQYSVATEFYQQSLERYRQIDDRYSQAVLWQAIGNIKDKLHQTFEARTAYEEACRFYSDIGMEELVEKCQQSLKALT
jgi:tetratricopeptide (TPR) repeat protein